jgi:virginiamycin B lyase
VTASNLCVTAAVFAAVTLLAATTRPAAGASTITEFPIPSGGPAGITAGPDGALWFTESGAGKIGRITTGGAVTEFPIPIYGPSPQVITAGSDGALWFTDEMNGIGRITTGGSVTQSEGGSSEFGITAGPDGALWCTWFGGDPTDTWVIPSTITQIIPGGGGAQFVFDPSGSSGPVNIVAGPDGALWFTVSGGGVSQMGA